MEKVLQNCVGYFFVALLIITMMGFYPTYLSKFPVSEGLTTAHHFLGLFIPLLCLLLFGQLR